MNERRPSGPQPPSAPAPDDRLDSWKEIASYLSRDVTTVQRWEKREGMPVHRHLHDKIGSVYAYKTEIDAWSEGRNPASDATAQRWHWRPGQPALGLAALLVTLGALAIWQLVRREAFWRSPLATARFVQITDFPGTERAAAISRDGRFVAFLADRDGRMDVWVTQVGTGQFYNLTRNDPREFVNPSVRTLGFSPDGSLLTFWVRRPGAPNGGDIGIWAAPILGGPPRPYLDGAAEFDWSPDGARLVYHTTGPGDPMFVRPAGDTGKGRQIYAVSAGLHGHFPVWSPDGRFIYFVQGSVPAPMDIWRIRSDGGVPERITHHDASVSHPVFVDSRTLLYLAGDADGDGPWLHSIDVERRIARRLTSGLDRYTSLAASADGQRLVVTQTRPTGTLWRLPLAAGSPTEMSAVRRIPLTTATGFCPRTGPDYLVYASSKGTGDTVWKSAGEAVTEIWSAQDSRIVGCPAVGPDGARIAFAVRQGQDTRLYVVNSDGTNALVIARSLDLKGSPAWSPDGRSITIATSENGVPHLVRIPLDGTAPATVVSQESIDPAWSPDGRFLMFSGADVGTTIAVSAVTADGVPYPAPKLTLTRGGRRLRFLPGGALVTLRGGIRHKDLWLVDLVTGAERQLTRFAADFDVGNFDLSSDGSEAIVEQLQDQSDIVMIERGRR